MVAFRVSPREQAGALLDSGAAANQLTQWSLMQYNTRVMDRLGARAATAANTAQLGLFSAAANPFRIRTSEQSHKCSFQRTYGNANSFRMRTYAKPGGVASSRP
jgi:hypothetical protein